MLLQLLFVSRAGDLQTSPVFSPHPTQVIAELYQQKVSFTSAINDRFWTKQDAHGIQVILYHTLVQYSQNIKHQTQPVLKYRNLVYPRSTTYIFSNRNFLQNNILTKLILQRSSSSNNRLVPSLSSSYRSKIRTLT